MFCRVWPRGQLTRSADLAAVVSACARQEPAHSAWRVLHSGRGMRCPPTADHHERSHGPLNDLAARGSACPSCRRPPTPCRIPPSLCASRRFALWLADATGQPVPDASEASDQPTDELGTLAWRGSGRVSRALAVGDVRQAAQIAADSITFLLQARGIEDDFCVLWPPLVLAALGTRDLELAERLLAPVESIPPDQRSPAVAAQFHRLQGLAAAGWLAKLDAWMAHRQSTPARWHCDAITAEAER
jgi:hypothetical protein